MKTKSCVRPQAILGITNDCVRDLRRLWFFHSHINLK